MEKKKKTTKEVAKKTVAKKTATKKVAAKSAVAKKTATKKVAAKKVAAKKVAAKSTVAKKTAAKKATVAKKTAAKKTAAKKATAATKKVATKKTAKATPIAPRKPKKAKRIYAKKNLIKETWWLADAEGISLGRLATELARVLRGKYHVDYSPHKNFGDFVVVLNAEKVTFTGSKWSQKKYYSHTGYFGSVKEITAEKLRDKYPERVIMKSVKGMLPKNALGRGMIKRLKVYKGSEHNHQAQNPQALSLENKNK